MRLKKQFWTSQGNPIGYNNMCVAENEERSAWEPFHVQKKFRADESVVSLFRGWSFVNNVVGSSQRSVGKRCLRSSGTAMPGLFSAATLILDPLVARHLKENEGFQNQAGFLPLDFRELQNACRAILGHGFDRHDDGSGRPSGR